MHCFIWPFRTFQSQPRLAVRCLTCSTRKKTLTSAENFFNVRFAIRKWCLKIFELNPQISGTASSKQPVRYTRETSHTISLTKSKLSSNCTTSSSDPSNVLKRETIFASGMETLRTRAIHSPPEIFEPPSVNFGWIDKSCHKFVTKHIYTVQAYYMYCICIVLFLYCSKEWAMHEKLKSVFQGVTLFDFTEQWLLSELCMRFFYVVRQMS